MSYVWLDGKLVSEEKANVSILSHALHYGTSAFEGIRFYETDKGPAIFRLPEHVKRLFYSARVLGMDILYSETEMQDAISTTVKKSRHSAGYIRPIFFYGESKLGLSTHGIPVQTAVIVLPWGKYLAKDGVTLKTTSVRRINSSAFEPRAKLGGVYVNSVIAHMEADAAGADEALLLTDNGVIAEGAGENFFLVKKNVLYTPPLGNILPGITRDTIFALANNVGITVKEKELTLKDAYVADECFFTGTAAEVTPIREIDGNIIGDGAVGPVARRLGELYARVVAGKEKKYAHWLTLLS